MKEWTFMIYMAGDNNLSDDMISSIDAIKTGVLNSIKPGGIPSTMSGLNNVAFLVEYDGSHPIPPTYQIDLTYVAPYDPWGKMTKVPDDDECIPTEEKINKFIQWAVRKYPAKNYALIVSGHSDGFRGRTLLLDDSEQSVGSLKKLSCQIDLAIRKLKETDPSLFPKSKLDLLCFDSCVMSSVEVMHEFKDCTHYWIGSQGSIPNYSWNYLGIAEDLVKMKKTDLTDNKVISVILNRIKEYNDTYAFEGRSIDVSAADLTKISDVEASLTKFALFLFLFSSRPGRPAWESDCWYRILTKAHVRTQTFMCEQSIDLWDFSNCLSEVSGEVKREIRAINSRPPASVKRFIRELSLVEYFAKQLMDSIERLIGSRTRRSGGDYRFAKGLSVFLPWSFLALKMSLPRYFDLAFMNDTLAGPLWFLFILFSLSRDARPPVTVPKLPKTMSIHASVLQSGGGNVAVTRTLQTATNEMSSIAILVLIKSIITALDIGNVKDNPPHSKGMDEYIEYFRTMKNYYPPLVK